MKPLSSGGGWQAIRYSLNAARKVGWLRLWRAMRSKNACKTCALGMGGQRGGMRNEMGHFPEVCKKSLQAMASDMQGKIEDSFFAAYSLEQLRGFSPRDLEMMGRLTTPIIAAPGDTHYRPLSWDDALGRIAGKLKSIAPVESFFYFSGRSSNEAGFLLQLFARVYGTNHVNNCSYYCHQASGVGLTESIGTGTATVLLEDVENTKLVFLIGGNPASNHPRLMSTLMRVRRNGGRVIVINPVKETGLVNFRVPSDPRSLLFGSEIASLYVQPHIGGDIAVMTGVAKRLLEWGKIDRDFIASATEGFEALRQHVESVSWDEIERESGVERAMLDAIARMYAEAPSAVFAWTMGITHHEHGVQNVQWIVNLALLRGMAGKPGAGLLPIRGHSNVQGLGSLGVTPAIKKAVFERLEALGIHPPTTPGYDTMATMQAAVRGEFKFGFCLGGNLFGSNPDANFSAQALSNLEQIVYLNTTLNTSHAWGRAKETLVLPVLARDEDPQKTTQESMFNYVRLSDGGAPRHAAMRSEVSIIAEIARRTLVNATVGPASVPAGRDAGPTPAGTPAVRSALDWQALENHSNIRKLIAQIVPGFEKLSEIDQTRQEFQVAGRTFHTPRFATPSGKALFKAHPIPVAQASSLQHPEVPAGSRRYALRLMTVRSEGQFNTVVYENEDIYRGQERRDVILMNEQDVTRLGLAVNQRVRVRSETGCLENILVRTFDIRAGNALMYYPEANVLVPQRVDPRSKTPAFKSTWVAIEPATDGVAVAQELPDTKSIRETARKLNAC